MGYQVYWANGRWQGYGVPAYCDFPGCKEEIDRGMGYQHSGDAENGSWVPELFSCNRHLYESANDFTPEKTPEHPKWINHILTDETWKEWRQENPEKVKEYQDFIES